MVNDCLAVIANYLLLNIERGHLVPKTRLAASNAGVTGANRPVSSLIPQYYWTVIIRFRSSAADFVKAPIFGRSFISKLLYKFFVLEMASPRAVIMNEIAVGE